MSTQLSFNLPARPALGRDDFFVSPSNAFAVSMIEDWPRWNHRKLLLSGPQGSGKTHLTHVWAQSASATVISASELDEANIATLAKGPVAVEDVPSIASSEAGQTALFYLHNLCIEAGQWIMFTGRNTPQHWRLTLPDLDSRMRGTTMADMSPPDDDLLKALLIKLFCDRQLSAPPEVINYVVCRIDRSFDSAQRLVCALDALSLAEKRPVSRSLAIQLLDTTQDNWL